MKFFEAVDKSCNGKGYVKIDMRGNRGFITVNVENLSDGKTASEVYLFKNRDEKIKIGPINSKRGRLQRSIVLNGKDEPIENYNICGVVVNDKVLMYTPVFMDMKATQLDRLLDEEHEEIMEEFTDQIPDQVPIEVPDQIPNQVPGRIPNGIPDQIPNQVPGRIPNEIPDQIPNQIPDQVPNGIPDQIPNQVPGRIPNVIPDQVPNQVPGRIPNGISNRVPNRAPNRAPNRIPNEVPDRIPDRTPGQIPENPEDKRIPFESIPEEEFQNNLEFEDVEQQGERNFTTEYERNLFKLLKEFEPVKPLAHDIKSMKWWKIVYDENSLYKGFLPYFNQIITTYYPYPMSNHITSCQTLLKKHGYYLFGIYEKNGKISKYVYGVPGKFTRDQQPYRGVTGFKNWSYKHNDIPGDYGYWLAFIDADTGSVSDAPDIE